MGWPATERVWRAALRAGPLLVALVVGATMAVARWTAHGPFGSDNDEYRMLAESLTRMSTVIAGVEGTKYPVGYSLLLAPFDASGLPVTGVALAVNVVVVAAIAVAMWRLVDDGDARVAGAVGATVVLLSAPLWEAVMSTMPDVLFVLVCAVAMWWAERSRPPGRLAVELSALAAVAVLLKSHGVVVAVAATAHLLGTGATRRLAWLPLAVTLVVLAGSTALTAGTPKHTTGYETVFWLSEPFDASQGKIGVADLPDRAAGRRNLVMRDVGDVLVGPDHGSGWSAAAMVGLMAVAGLTMSRHRWFIIGLVVSQVAMMAIWPYSGARFYLVLLPVIGAGAAMVARRIVDGLESLTGSAWSSAAAAVVCVLVVGPLAATTGHDLSGRAAVEDRRIAGLEAQITELRGWMDQELTSEERLASPDYRELSYRTGRTYLPVSYTLDSATLRGQTFGRAEFYVAVWGLNPGRDAVHRVVTTSTAGAAPIQQCAVFGEVIVYWQGDPEARPAACGHGIG